jgi:non-specific serine/threonine protein kinase
MAGLPGEPTGFVGRRTETAHVKQLLAASRLVTLTGPGGVGKTRLCLHVARGLRRAFPDGIRYAELAAVDDPALVPAAVATAAELPDTTSHDVTALLEARFAGARALLVLDNCEHLVPAVGALVGRLLARAPRVRFLVTSRAPLRISGEQVLPVAPLSLPGPGELGGEAMALFEARAAAVVPGFTVGPSTVDVVGRLCRRLDGLPLAIELAAARMRVLSPEQILERLAEPHAIGETMHNAIQQSYDLCTGLERTLWARLSVFSGGFDLDAAERVGAGGVVAGPEVLDGITGLVDKSVLTSEHVGSRARYHLLETIRAFGRQRLAAAGEEHAVRRLHRDHYLALARQAEADWSGPRQLTWLDRVQLEQAEVWAALGFSLGDAGETGRGVELATALWWFWGTRAVRDGREWLGRAVATSPGDAAPGDTAKASQVAGWLALAHGDAPAAVRLLGAMPDEAAVLGRPGLGPSALAWCALPVVAGLLGDPGQAAETCRMWTERGEAAGEQWARSWASWVLAIARWRADAPGEAREHARNALRLKRSLKDQLGLPPALALVAALEADQSRAAFLFGAAEQLWEPVEPPVFGWGTFRDWYEQWRAHLRDAMGERAFEAACTPGRAAEVDTALAHALGETAAKARGRAATPAPPRLTRREMQVANLIAEGRSNREIAAELVISQRTAETHVENILSKLGFTSRTQVAVWISRR